jgi:hypothetical protein
MSPFNFEDKIYIRREKYKHSIKKIIARNESTLAVDF